MRYIIDRIEGRFAILEGENGEISGVELNRLPPDVKEGDVLDHRIGQWSVDKEETENRRLQNRQKLHRLWEE